MVVLAALTDVDMLFADPVVLMSTFTTVEALCVNRDIIPSQ